MKQTTSLSKRKFERHHWIAFPTIEAETKGLSLLKQDGPVHGLDFGYEILGVTASESQLKKLTKEGIPWEFAAEVRKRMKEEEDGNKAKQQSTKKTVRTANHRRKERTA